MIRISRHRNVIAALLLAPSSALAGNGILPTGFGVEAQGLGGADAALSRDSMAVNGNPAGLTQIRRKALDMYLSPFVSLRTKHRDSLGNNNDVDNPPGFLMGGGFARRHSEHLVVGAGLMIQGGTGFQYDNLITGYGNRDDIAATVAVSKLALAAAWQVDPKISLGVAAGLSYGVASQEFFADTSDAQASFFGYDMDGLDGFGIGGKLGLQYQYSPTLRLGFVYTSETPIDLSGGSLTANFRGLGLGRVRYDRANLDGLSFGQQIELGLLWRPSDNLLLSVELQWIDWSSSMRHIELRATNPDSPDAPAEFGFVSPLDWRDQYPVSIGAMYRLNPKTWLRVGYSHARNPTPDHAQNPTFAVIAENQIALSMRRELNTHWSLDVGLEYQPYREHRYTNPALLIGTDATETNSYLWLHFMLGKRWG